MMSECLLLFLLSHPLPRPHPPSFPSLHSCRVPSFSFLLQSCPPFCLSFQPFYHLIAISPPQIDVSDPSPDEMSRLGSCFALHPVTHKGIFICTRWHRHICENICALCMQICTHAGACMCVVYVYICRHVCVCMVHAHGCMCVVYVYFIITIAVKLSLPIQLHCQCHANITIMVSASIVVTTAI